MIDRVPGVVETLLDAEDAAALVVENIGIGQLVDRAAAGEVRVHRQPRLRPLRPLGQPLGDERGDPLVPRLNEGRSERPVVTNKLLTDAKDVHACPSTG